jgi:hypothetical protein
VDPIEQKIKRKRRSPSPKLGKRRTLSSEEELELINELTSPLAEGMGYKLV